MATVREVCVPHSPSPMTLGRARASVSCRGRSRRLHDHERHVPGTALRSFLRDAAPRPAGSCPPRGLKLFFPVICSAATLTRAVSDYRCLIPWLRMNDPRHIPSRTRGELTLVVLTIAGGYIACSSTSGWARLMYLHETLFASCHLIFVPDIGRCVRRIVDNRMDTRGPLRLFLRRHTLRILTVDTPAFFFCFLECLAVYTLISATVLAVC
ncbi:hypothetical protein EDD15DRAFT_2267863 [Pisolithus albus]|nr:hypothetical protein EDD15DRAFT_2267863 [Pisolithus albus]